MFEVTGNEKENRLSVVLHGPFAAEEMKSCVEQAIEATSSLTPGYTVGIESVRYEPANPEVNEQVKLLMEHFRQTKARVNMVGEKGLHLHSKKLPTKPQTQRNLEEKVSSVMVKRMRIKGDIWKKPQAEE